MGYGFLCYAMVDVVWRMYASKTAFKARYNRCQAPLFHSRLTRTGQSFLLDPVHQSSMELDKHIYININEYMHIDKRRDGCLLHS